MSQYEPPAENGSGASRDNQLPGDLSHVLVSSCGKTSGSMHRPHPLNDAAPACGRSLENKEGTWIVKDHGRQTVFYDRCGECPWPDENGGVGRWSCPDCPRGFPTRQSLRGHRRGQCDGVSTGETTSSSSGNDNNEDDAGGGPVIVNAGAVLTLHDLGGGRDGGE